MLCQEYSSSNSTGPQDTAGLICVKGRGIVFPDIADLRHTLPQICVDDHLKQQICSLRIQNSTIHY